MAGWAVKIMIWLIGISLIGLIAGYMIGGFAVGRDTHRVYHGYHMPVSGADARSATLSGERDRLNAVALAEAGFD